MNRPRVRLSRLRVAFQVLLHLVLVGHVLAYYFLDWKAVGALDFQAFFHHFLGEGLLTAGGLLTLGVYGTAVIWGRLFCSWGCHFGATQDAVAWVLRRLGWKPVLLRTRFLHWSPYLILLAVFVLPLLDHWSAKEWGLRYDLAAVAPWDTLPGWVLSALTFLGCGAAVLLFLGTRGFCRFICPYGALFRVTDRLAPWRVRRVAPCASGCGTVGVHPCTAACPTAIDVHAETSVRGHVTSPDCVRCHLCIEACPTGALAHTAPWSAERRLRSSALAAGPLPRFHPLEVLASSGVEARGPRHDLPAWAEATALVAAIATYLAVDLVYGGHFLAAALALGEGFLVVTALRAVLGDSRATFFGRPLREGRAWTLAGIAVTGLTLASAVPVIQAGAFKWLRAGGLRLDPWPHEEASAQDQTSLDPSLRQKALAAAESYRRALLLFPGDAATRKLLIRVYARAGDRRALAEAEELLRRQGPGNEEAQEIRRWVLRRVGVPVPARGRQ